MKIVLQTATGDRRASEPYENSPFVEVDGWKCKCGGRSVAAKRHSRGHATIIGEAHCVRCDAVVGTLIVHIDTLFGIEEDERVLNGPWRVY